MSRKGTKNKRRNLDQVRLMIKAARARQAVVASLYEGDRRENAAGQVAAFGAVLDLLDGDEAAIVRAIDWPLTDGK